MKIIITVVFVVIGLALGTYFYTTSSTNEPTETPKAIEKVDYKASFVIFTNGTLRDFSDSKYHNQSKDVFITSENPNAIYIKKEGITWDDFFKTLPSPMKLTKDCLITGTGQEFCTNNKASLKFYLNGKLDLNLLSKKIMDGDKALITFGSEDENEIKIQLKSLE